MPRHCVLSILALLSWTAAPFAPSKPPLLPSAHRRPSHLKQSTNDNDDGASREASSSDKTAVPVRPGSMTDARIRKGRVPYGEESRKYRRTVYTHEDWVVHRSNERISDNIRGIFLSGIVRQLLRQVGVVFLSASAVVVANVFAVPYANAILRIPLRFITLPALPFTISSSSLGLLLVFRTNSSYQRYCSGRISLGRIFSQSSNAIRMACTFADLSGEEGRRSIDRLLLATWAFNRSVVNRFSPPQEDGEKFEAEMKSKFTSGVNDDPMDFLPYILSIDPAERPQQALMEMSLALNGLPIDEKRRVEIDKSCVIMGDCLAECERVFTSPVPLVYTRHTSRFLSLWLLLLPMALFKAFSGGLTLPPLGSGVLPALNWGGIATIPAAALMALFLFGISELAVQLEEPFSILPLQKLCDDNTRATHTMRDRAVTTAMMQR